MITYAATFKSGFKAGQDASHGHTSHPGLSHPCPYIPGHKNYHVWMDGYRAGNIS